ncbi:hypothetical protein HYX02_02370 [Candidatus Woesearchaeota archaeon]|nr:hypothetical protein [Candidatus Woesearchaeota archaeon]
MRFWLFCLIFVISSYNVFASWQTYQNDLRNSGTANGTGYFPLNTANFTEDNLGMEFQPLVEDLNLDGKAEIVIFANNSLIVFDPQLKILNQTKTGAILGQPALFDFDSDNLVEIIFNSIQNSTDYFFAYQYNNSNLRQEFNITLNNEANFSGIKCLNLNGTNSCVFKDKRNYVHIVNMASKTDISYNTSAYNETKQTVPAIGDIDNDGRYEAVFWFDENGDREYGFMVFDLNNRSLETNFNNSGIVDDIFIPISAESFALKGQPVLVDLNNDKKLEIAASVFYDDNLFPGFDAYTDWFTEIFVYSYTGTKLFSKCEAPTIISSGCNDGGGSINKWEGTNPFVLDYDKNGIDDICFIKDEKSGVSFDYMALNCYNYSGDEIAKVNLTDIQDGVKGTAMAADMNNDGEKEIITLDKIYLLNGTPIFTYPLNVSHPVAVDIDGNNGLDLIWTRNYQTKVFLDNFNYSVDLSVNADDIIFTKFNKTHINVSALIKNIGQAEVNNIRTIIYNTETLENKTFSLNIRRNGNATISALLGLKESQKVLVSVDFDNEINETDETNNAAVKEFVDLPFVFVSVDAEPFIVGSKFQNYIKSKLTSGYYTTNENEADVKVYIGKNHPINAVNNVRTLDEFEFGYDYGNIIFNDKTGTLPFSGLVGSFKDANGKTKIMIAGNEIDGDIAAVKEFIKNQVLFLNTKTYEAVFVDDENAEAVKVWDYLHLGGNEQHYKVGNDAFKRIVRNALNDEMFNVFDKSVVTSNGITLRLRNLKPNASSDYLEYLNSTGVPVEMPVVLAHGLFSNLTSWEVLGAEISNIGRDTWLIEITGGPGQDCDDCIDYTFYNLTDVFVPALLNGVLDFTGKDKIQYVGFSNGCRAALDSLERNKFDSSKVETFVAVGCPGGFEKLSLLDSGILLVDDKVLENIQNKNVHHVDVNDLLKLGLLNKNDITKEETGKISLNLWKKYLFFMSSSNDTQPGKINITKFGIIQGNAFGTSDGIVPTIDEDSIYSNVKLRNSNNDKINPLKQSFRVLAFHSNLDTTQKSKTLIRKLLNNEDLSFFEKTFNLLNQSDIVG